MVSGALAYVLLPVWATQSPREQAAGQIKIAYRLVCKGLVLAVQLLASLAFPVITCTKAGTPERQHAVGLAFLVAWTLACAAVAVVATFSFPIANLLFGWGRMSASALEVIAQWSAIGIWSLLPQALMAVLLTVMATNRRMQAAVRVMSAGLAVMVSIGWLGGFNGQNLMWLLNAVFACTAVV